MDNYNSLNIEFIENWLNSATEYVFCKDLDGIYRFVSKSTAILAGCNSPQEMIGKTDFEVYEEENAKNFTLQDKKVIENRQSCIVEDWVKHPLEGNILLETIKYPMYDKEENIIGIAGTARNITLKYLMQEKIKEQSSQLSAVLNNIPYAIWLKDNKNHYLMVNNLYEQFYDVSFDDIAGNDVFTTLKNNSSASDMTMNDFAKTDELVLKEKEVTKGIFPMVIHGENRFVEITKAPVLNEQNEAIGLLGISEDITDMKNYQELLVKSKIAAEKANVAKSAFLANMSHEIRTPMNGILGFLQLLQDTNLSVEQRDFVEEAIKSSEILLSLLNNILDLSKVEAGKMELEHISFNIRQVIEDVATLASSNISKKPVEINAICYSDVPEKLFGDPNKLKQVLNNFMNNAIKFTAQGEINLSIKLIEKQNDKIKVQFDISDTGIGISEENQSKVFEAFTQADSSTTRNYGGTGLGLAIVKKIIHLMGGEVSLKSKLNEGSTFSFTAYFDIDESNDNKEYCNVNFINNKKILIVDDNLTNLKVLEYYLSELNSDVICANSAIEALEILNKCDKDFDIILTDYAMPELNGVEFATKVLAMEKYHNIPIVLVTARILLSSYMKIKDNKLCGYLPKPIRKQELFDCISSVLNNKPLQQSNTIQQENTDQTQISEIYKNNEFKILVVEDNTLNQKLITKMLNKLELDCDIANNGQEAITMYFNFPYDIIFMDCQMPVMDGYTATSKIREKNKDIPIIALTANAMNDDLNKCLAVGMSDYLSKPINFGVLTQKLEKYLQDSAKKHAEIQKKDVHNTGISIENIAELAAKDLGIDKNDAIMLINEYLEEFDARITELENEINSNNFEQAAQVAHNIKGASGNLRLNFIYETMKQIEQQLKNNQLNDIWILIEEIKNYRKNL